jgi:hypothetical protein
MWATLDLINDDDPSERLQCGHRLGKSASGHRIFQVEVVERITPNDPAR